MAGDKQNNDDDNSKSKRPGFHMNRLLVNPMQSFVVFVSFVGLLGFGLQQVRDVLASQAADSTNDSKLYLYRGEEAAPVMEYVGAEEENFLTNTNVVRVVEFYNRWCGHCQSFVPKYIQLARDYQQEPTAVSFHAVSCAAHNDFCQQLGLSGSSSLQIFAKGNLTPQPVKMGSFMGGYTLQDVQAAVREVDFVSNLGGVG